MYTNYSDEYSFCKPFLCAGEAVLWKGKPEKGHLFTAQDVFMIPFSIFWCGFALFWEITTFTSGAPFFFKLWGIPFVCVGLYMVFGRFLWTAYIRKRTAYVITNKKILRIRGKKIDIQEGKSMPSIHVTVNRNGSGTIRFGQAMDYHGRTTYPDPRFALENVPNVARIQQIIDQIER